MFLPSWCNFTNIVLKFCLCCQLRSPNKSPNFKTGLKDKNFLYFKLLIKFMDVWALFVMFNKSMNFIRRLNRGNFYFSVLKNS